MLRIRTTSMSTTARSTATSSAYAASSARSTTSSTQAKGSMAPDIDSRTSEERVLALKWSNRISLTPRILAVNIFALALLAGGFSYLDSYRERIVESRIAQSSREVRLIAQSLASATQERRDLLVLSLARDMGVRIRLYDETGK